MDVEWVVEVLDWLIVGLMDDCINPLEDASLIAVSVECVDSG